MAISHSIVGIGALCTALWMTTLSFFGTVANRYADYQVVL